MDINIYHLTKVYRGGITALDDVNLKLVSGMIGLLGPNGAGKTTLMRILATLVKPSHGRAIIGGLDVTDSQQKWAVKRLLGYLPQELSLYENLSVCEFLDYMATLKELHDSRARSREVERVLSLTGLEPMAARRIKALSGGMKRRVGIAQALIGDPQLLIVDEPTVGLDPEERVRFRMLLARLAHQRIVILSTHIVEDISTTCQDMVILQQGRVLFHGSPSDFAHTAADWTWQLTLPLDRQPDPAWQVATSVRDNEALRLRIVGPRPVDDAVAVAPTLEEAYLAFMAQAVAPGSNGGSPREAV